MGIKIKISKNTMGDGGQMLEAGGTYEVKSNVAMELVRNDRGKIEDSSLLKVRILEDNLLRGYRFGDVIEMTATAAARLVKENRGELFLENEVGPRFWHNKVEEDIRKVKLLITENTTCEVDGKKGTFVEAGKVYEVKNHDASLLIALDKARFTPATKKVEVRFKAPKIFNGQSYKADDTAKISPADAESLIKKRPESLELLAIIEREDITEPAQPEQAAAEGSGFRFW